MSRSVLGRACFAVTAVLVAVGVTLSVIDAGTATDGRYDNPLARVLNAIVFFTIVSNLIVGVTCAQLATGRARDTPWFRAFRLAGVICIAVTGVVYNVALTGLRELDGSALVADQIVHIVVPIVAVAGWLVFGPRGLVTSWDDVGRACVIPLAWVAFTMLKGPIVDFYPYPFMDVVEKGYARVLVNLVVVALLFLGLAAAALALDRRLPAFDEPQAADVER